MHPTLPGTSAALSATCLVQCHLCQLEGHKWHILSPKQVAFQAFFVGSSCSHRPFGDALGFTVGQMALTSLGAGSVQICSECES